MRIHIVRRGMRGREKHACVGSRAAARSNERVPSLSHFRSVSLFLVLPVSPYLSVTLASTSSSSSRLLLSLLGRARALANTLPVSHFCSQVPVVASLFFFLFSMTTTTARHRFSLVVLVLCLVPFPSVRREAASHRFHYYRR